MKVVGHAAGVHAGGGGGGSGAVGGANNGSGGVGGGGGEMIYGIEEDDELSEGTKSFAVTGKSGIVREFKLDFVFDSSALDCLPLEEAELSYEMSKCVI